jgi:hypothetical protein
MMESMKMRWAGQVDRMVEKRTADRLLIGKVTGKELARKTKS